MNKKVILLSLIFISMAFFMIAGCFFGYINVNIFKTKQKAEAIILLNTISHSSTKNSHRIIKYSYVINNNTYTKSITTNTSDMSNLEKGDKINIYYDPDNPQKSGILHLNFTLLFFGILFAFIGIFILIFRKKIILKI